jgi:hypothetical protein
MDFIWGVSARQFIEMIANDHIEESHDKIKKQRDDFIRWAKEWLEQHQEQSIEDMIGELEVESRLMRARNERLEKENLDIKLKVANIGILCDQVMGEYYNGP